MIKKVIALFAIFFALLSNHTFAHTGLEDSTPKDGKVITESLQQITLNFTTKIEQTSTIEVVSSNGEPVNLGNFIIEENEIWATFLQPLENGNYQVVWKIVGADGHPIEGDFSFTVNLPVGEPPSGEQSKESAQGKNREADTAKAAKQETEANKMPSYIIPAIIGVLLLIVIGSFLWLMRGKSRKC